MANAPYAYSFLDVICAIAGPGGGFPIAGDEAGNADEGIKIAYADDKGSLTTGADGTWMHSLHASNAGTCDVTLMKNSPTNQLLQIMYDFQRSTAANFGQNTIILTNPVSGDMFTLAGCGFKKFPDTGYGKEGPTMTWSFNVGRIDPLLGSGI